VATSGCGQARPVSGSPNPLDRDRLASELGYSSSSDSAADLAFLRIATMVQKTTKRIVVTAIVSWWVILLVGFGLLGNGILLLAAFRAGNVVATILLGVFFCAACFYLYRLYRMRDEIGAITRD